MRTPFVGILGLLSESSRRLCFSYSTVVLRSRHQQNMTSYVLHAHAGLMKRGHQYLLRCIPSVLLIVLASRQQLYHEHGFTGSFTGHHRVNALVNIGSSASRSVKTHLDQRPLPLLYSKGRPHLQHVESTSHPAFSCTVSSTLVRYSPRHSSLPGVSRTQRVQVVRLNLSSRRASS